MNIFNRSVVEDTMDRFGFGSKKPPETEKLIDLDNIDFESEEAPSKEMPAATPNISFKPKDPTYRFKYGSKSEPYREYIEQMESKHGLPKGMLPNLIGFESSWNPKAVSKAGAQGFMQLMPDTAKMLGVKDPFDPYQSIEGGVKYLKRLKKRFGTWEKAWAAYNMGPTNFAKGKRFKETENYVKQMKDLQETEVVSPTIDFESNDPIDLSAIDEKEPPGIYMPKKQTLWEKFKNLIVDPGMDPGKAANIVSLSEEYGISPTRAEKYYDELGKLTFTGTYPSSRDIASGLMGAAVTTGIIFNPVATAIGVGTFMGLDELENYVISKVKEDPYHFQGGQGLSDLLQAHGLSKDAIDLLDFMWKIPTVSGTTKFGRETFGAITARLKGETNKVRFVNKVVEDVKSGKSPDDAAIENAKEFGLSEKELFDTTGKKDIEVKVESEEPVHPLEITRPTEAEPAYTFTSQKGNHYEKIGEDWYDSKGKKVTNAWVVKAAEKKKVKYGESEEAAVEMEIADIEAKTGKRIEEVSEEEIDSYLVEKDRSIFEQTGPIDLAPKAAYPYKGRQPTPAEKIPNLKEGVFDYQNRVPEKIVHRDWDKSNSFRWILEGSGDILREFSLRENFFDPMYIREKLKRIDRYLKGEESGKIHIDDTRKGALRTQKKNLNDLIKAYEDQPTKTPEQGLAKDLTLAIAKGDFVEARRLYNEIDNFIKTEESPTISEDRSKFKQSLTPDELEATELFYDRRIKELSDEEVELFLEDYRAKQPAAEPEGSFFKSNEAIAKDTALYEERAKAVESNPEMLTEKLINDVNRWYKGDESVDINAVRNTLDMMRDRAEDIKNAYFDPPDSIWLAWKEKVTKATDWARELDRSKIEPSPEGTKLTSGVDPTDILKLAKTTMQMSKDAFELGRKIFRGEVKKADVLEARKMLKDEVSDLKKAGNIEDAFELGIRGQYFGEAIEFEKILRGETKGLEEKVKLLKELGELPKEGPTFYSGAGYLDKSARKLFDKLKRTLKRDPEPPEPFSDVKGRVKEIVHERRENLNLSNYETNKFINSIEQNLDLTQREAMPFVIEGTDVPKELGRPDLQKTINKHGEMLKTVAQEVKDHFNEGWKKIKAHVPDLSVKQIEDYVTHLWDVPKHKRAEAVSWFQTQNRFLEKRFIDTYKEGIERGFKPKVLDISEIIRIHDSVSNRAIENTKYINALLKLKDQGMYLIQRTGTAPMEWIEVDYPALTRRIPLTKKVAGKKGEFVKELKVRVHPDLVRPLKAIFEQRFDHPIISAYEAINGILKKSMLSISLFHHGALGETGVALIGPGKTARIMFDPVKIYKSLAKGEYDIFTKEPLAKDAISHGIQFGATADIPIGKIQGYLNDLAKATENKLMVGRITKALKNSNSLWDRALWNYLHDTLKLYGYEAMISKLDPNMGPLATKMAKREIAQMVNDTFGGQNWDTLMLSPKETQMLTWSLLSSDWTLSTTRQALSPTGLGKVYKETADLRKKLGRRFWIRAAIYFGIGINGLNVLFREKDMKENPQYYRGKEYSLLDKTMFGNSVGRKTRLFVGRYKDGSERYIKWGKQFSDFYELIESPLKKIGGKTAPVPGLISEIGDIDDYGKKKYETAFQVFKKIAEAPIPFALRRLINENIEFKPTDVFMPSSKGMTRYSALEYFKHSIVNKDYDMMREVYENCLRNNLPPNQLLEGAASWVENEIMTDVAKDVESIKDAEMKLNMASSAYDKRRYGIILRRLNKEKADKEAGLKRVESAIEKIKVLNSLGKGEVPRLPRSR